MNFPHFESQDSTAKHCKFRITFECVPSPKQELRALYDFLQDEPWKFRVIAAPWFFLRPGESRSQKTGGHLLNRSTADLVDLYRQEICRQPETARFVS